MLDSRSQPRQKGKKMKMNNKDYKFYVLNKAATKILSGWEYREDAVDFQSEYEGAGRIYGGSTLKKFGLNANKNEDWGQK